MTRELEELEPHGLKEGGEAGKEVKGGHPLSCFFCLILPWCFLLGEKFLVSGPVADEEPVSPKCFLVIIVGLAPCVTRNIFLKFLV